MKYIKTGYWNWFQFWLIVSKPAKTDFDLQAQTNKIGDNNTRRFKWNLHEKYLDMYMLN